MDVPIDASFDDDGVYAIRFVVFVVDASSPSSSRARSPSSSRARSSRARRDGDSIRRRRGALSSDDARSGGKQ